MRRFLARFVPMVVVGLLAVACSNGGGTVTPAGDAPADVEVAETVAAETIPTPDTVTEPDDFVLDLGPDVPFTECEPGTGCFLDPCLSNEECRSGWCVEHMGDGVCSQACHEECPPGWSCKAVGTGGPDVSWVCISQVSNLCKPCATSADCKSPGGADDVCVAYGEEGSFCGGKCLSDEECPWGFSCSETVTVSGTSTLQCVAETGSCPCAGKSIELALFTPCQVENEFGLCEGKRVCTTDGLTDCDAATPTIEECNGLDDDCDGEVDEETCDDDNACTDDWCDPAEGCVHSNTGQKECMDGDACTIGDHCEEGVCIGTPIDCDDDNPCTDDACDGLGGCIFVDNDVACDDGDPCTVADQCSSGACAGVSVPCDCEADADCAALEDDNLCNGTLVCDLDNWPYHCTVAPATVIACPEPEGPDAPCLAPSCDPETGACSVVPGKNGVPCDDGNACTLADTCADGICVGGPEPNCNDGNPCTDDACNPAEGCFFVDNDVPCNDGDVCTVSDQCAGGVCAGGPALDCDDGDACNGIESCDSGIGCVAGDPLACDDGNPCNGIESCVPATGCQAGPEPVCDDGDPCNGTESCQPGVGCKPGKALVCDDGDLCNGVETCVAGEGCKPGKAMVCNDNNPCTFDSCDPEDGCLFTANAADCDDGNACTLGDHCEGGKCVNDGPVACDDGEVCTTDSCDPKVGCLFKVNAAPCDDGDLCTTGDTCSLGECKGTGTLACDDNNPCTADSCEPESGCTFTPQEGDCDDGNACTEEDQCSGGSCLGLVPADCDDGNVCTKDICMPATGCDHLFLAVPCDDNDPCTLGDVCSEGSCAGPQPANCDDGNPCTLGGCVPGVGCDHQPQPGACNDGNPCTVDDTCVGGQCVAGGAKDCDDGNACTDDWCDPAEGCVHGNTGPKECDDGSLCTTDDLCAGGQCTGTPVDCDDGDACTTDSCIPESGCQYTPIAPCCGNGQVEDGELCDDGNNVDGDGCEGDCQSYSPLNITFTHCGQTGPTGPSQGQCDAAYAGKQGLEGKVTLTNGIQYWTVPYTGTYRVTAAGAQGYNAGSQGGYGAVMRGDLSLTAGQKLKILVGQQGTLKVSYGGGGGGTFVATDTNTALIVAGGGGGYDNRYAYCADMHGTSGLNGNGSCNCAAPYGGGTNAGGGDGGSGGGGGGGFLSNGAYTNGGYGFVNGGNGGVGTHGDGGFGGGGGTDDDQATGGGGYAGGAGCGEDGNGGGGGSYNSGSNQSNQSGQNSGHGSVQIEYLG